MLLILIRINIHVAATSSWFLFTATGSTAGIWVTSDRKLLIFGHGTFFFVIFIFLSNSRRIFLNSKS
jgi:hypothetical protein